MDQRGKQHGHLVRSTLIVIAGGFADNPQQPLSLVAMLAWTSHHDLQLPGSADETWSCALLVAFAENDDDDYSHDKDDRPAADDHAGLLFCRSGR
jgi:hypothetical protein